MTPLLMGFGTTGIQALRHQLVAAPEGTAAIALGDDAALAGLNTLSRRHSLRGIWLNLPAGLHGSPGWQAAFEERVLGLYQHLQAQFSVPGMIVLYAELGTLDSGGVAALFARELAAQQPSHQLVVNLFRPRADNGAAAYLADTQLFTLGHCAMSLQIVAEAPLTRNLGAGDPGFAAAAAMTLWSGHVVQAGLVADAAASRRRSRIGLVSVNGARVRQEPRAAA